MQTTDVQITAAQLRPGDVVLAGDGGRAYAAYDVHHCPAEGDGTHLVRVWTGLRDQEAGRPELLAHRSSALLRVQRRTA